MRIGFDAKRFFNNKRGLGNYSRNLIAVLNDISDELYLFHTKKIPNTAFNIVSPTGFFINFTSLWRSFFICSDIQKSNIDVYIGASNELPFCIKKSNVKSIVVIHDIMYKILPKHYKIWDRIIYDWKLKNALKHADSVVAISENTKNDILSYYAVEADKIEVIYQHCDNIFNAEDNNELKENYFIAVGFSDPKKNTELLLKAWFVFEQQNINSIKLLLIGSSNTYSKKIEALVKQLGLKHVVFKYNLDTQALVYYYKKALALVFISKYEGFGLPIIEALHCNCQVITLNKSAMKEAGKDNVFYAEENSQSISKMLQDIAYNKKRININKSSLFEFSKENASAKWLKLVKSLV